MRSFLLIFFFFLCNDAMAQPVLTAANMNPVAGDTYILISCDSTGLAAAATGPGPDKTWDYSHLVRATATTASTNAFQTNLIDSFTSISFVPCSAIPGGVPSTGATIATIRYDSVFSAYWQSQGRSSDSFFEFFLTDSSQYYYPIPLAAISTHNRQPITLLRYPFTYNSSFVDTTPYSEMDHPLTLDFSYTSINTITADAYGTLKIPGHTYANALRVHITTIHKDTGVLWHTLVYANYASESYQWFVPGFHVPVLEVDNDTLGGVPIGAEYYTGPAQVDGLSGISYALEDVNVYPNPARDKLHITYNLLSSQPVAMRLTDVTGKCVYAMSIDKTTTGMNEANISVAVLQPGIYFLQLQQGGDMVNKKISVIR
jgi:hypothetical protein